MSYTIISWYTPDYAAQNANLLASLEKFGYSNHVEYRMKPAGRWLANVMLKPEVIRRAFIELDTDLVYLDSDAIIHGPLDLFDRWSGEDVGFHFRHGVELLGGTMYLSNRRAVWSFCDEVAGAMKAVGQCWQVTANRLLQNRLDLSVKHLPAEYARIFDAREMNAAGIAPVVEHMQYSRKVAH